ncbi:SUMO-activating enzyme subunit 2 [Capsaspora owczarzaki ATCC 30864]|uniref:SUMO-activating enzyme subunit n=1 Tax=Capsaspora owczarzaki (strain ATCC 30864) TaxID=595528 RepID=A0A0D2X0T9_CAPO3|nr:SUMO-activating enzyme subunit 2 [Capsaspora owczarzaki ATCC 30864]KJE89639.1 SUMO-activating enzyme subunit 2 [Capsaspora owczarzaki ATCC 30864]|eukprot:XP_004365946.1 SUMO-activating enzyme subunit 2 [Capsaspora owczarzaki ATCC 30864]
MATTSSSNHGADRSAAVSRIVGDDVYARIKAAKVLMVGAGGIGCELLKNLVLSGFVNVVVVDLDTIEVSNLNRQFLFQRQHVGLPKAQVAADSARRFNPQANIVFHHANIKNKEFSQEWFGQFDLVLNALDNVSARNHVNRMCLAADVPLVESGTAGYLGQVTVIKKGATECFECTPKPPPKQHPVCTIRNTPSLPIHCIVWGKFLFNQLFGLADDENNISPNTADPEAAGDNADAGRQDVDGRDANAELSSADSATNNNVQSLRAWAIEHQYHADETVQKLFVNDVKTLLRMDKLWRERRPPVPLDTLLEQSTDGTNDDGPASSTRLKDQRVWGLKECTDVFRSSLSRLAQRLSEEQAKAAASGSSEAAILSWDKDDDLAMDFVTAAANLRMSVFSIPNMCRFDAKSMAGNIIPAIATTNAIVAGLIVLEAMKILRDQFSICRMTFLARKPNSRMKVLLPTELSKPNPNCHVCAAKPRVTVHVNTNTMTLGQFDEVVLKGRLGMIAPDMMEGNRILLSSEPGETDINNPKALSSLGIVHDTSVFVEDFHQSYELTIRVLHREAFEADAQFVVEGQGSVPPPAAQAPAAPAPTPSADRKRKAEDDSDAPAVVDDDDIVLMDDGSASDHQPAAAHVNKKHRLETPADDEDDIVFE